MAKKLISPSDPVHRAISRRNKALAQPYVSKDAIAGGNEKARWFIGTQTATHRDFIKEHMRKAASPRSGRVDPNDIKLVNEDPIGDPVGVFINHGRWMARCPDCMGCEVAEPADLVFMCLSCYNYANEGRLRPVLLPNDKGLIENTLILRPLYENRNWTIVESVSDLVAENIANGVIEEV